MPTDSEEFIDLQKTLEKSRLHLTFERRQVNNLGRQLNCHDREGTAGKDANKSKGLFAGFTSQ